MPASRCLASGPEAPTTRPARDSFTGAEEAPPGRVEVGTVLRPHGVAGEVVVETSSDVAARYAPGSQLDAVGRDGVRTALAVRAALPLGRGRLRVAFEAVESRAAAEALRGARLEVERAAVPPAPPGAYWQFELLGCRAVDEAAGELGRVVELLDLGAGPLLVVELPGARRVPLPFVERFVVAVDPAAKRIVFRLPEGLIEACASRS